MAEYIDRREAEMRIADLIGNVTKGRCPTWNEVHEALYDLPFIQVVRCKDCALKIPCTINYEAVEADNDYWFCASGVAKEGDDHEETVAGGG